MPSMIDHIVIVDRDLDTMVRQAESLGFTVVPGGEHAGGMTHNALIGFRDGSYIELIAFIDPDTPSPHRWWPRLNAGGGLVDFALYCADLEADVTEIRGRGLDIPGVVDNGRLRPDGERLAWRQSFPQPVVGETGMPFLIEDVTPRPLRVPGDPSQTTHRNGVIGIAGMTLLVDDLDAAATMLAAITGNAPIPVDPPFPGTSAGRRISVGTELGQWIVVATPDLGNDMATQPADYVEQFGLGPYSVLLTTGAGSDSLRPNDGTGADASMLAASRLRIA